MQSAFDSKMLLWRKQCYCDVSSSFNVTSKVNIQIVDKHICQRYDKVYDRGIEVETFTLNLCLKPYRSTHSGF